MKVVGIDNGFTGALVGIETDKKGKRKVYGVHDMPVIKPEGKHARKSDKQIDGLALHRLLTELSPDLIVTEKLWGRPNQNAGAMWRMAESYGILIGVCMVYPCELLTVVPAVWQRKYGLIGREKEAHRQTASKLYKAAGLEFLTRKKDHDRADALLLADYGLAVSH